MLGPTILPVHGSWTTHRLDHIPQEAGDSEHYPERPRHYHTILRHGPLACANAGHNKSAPKAERTHRYARLRLCLVLQLGDTVNGVEYVVKAVVPRDIVVDLDPPFNVATPADVQRHMETLQPFAEAIKEVLEPSPETVAEWAQARIKLVAQQRMACFHKDKPCIRWLSIALLCPQAFEVSGELVSLASDGGAQEDTDPADLDIVPNRTIRSYADFMCKL